jgi:hypothetical protein
MANEYYSADGVFLNSKGEVVYGNDPDKKMQIVAAGGSIPLEVAIRYGIIKDATPAAPAAEPVETEVVEDIEAPQEVKATAPQANKALVVPPQNKGGGKK